MIVKEDCLHMASKEMEEMVQTIVDKRVGEIKRSLVPHTCFTCKWFVMRTEKPRNRVCRYPGDLRVKGRLCLCWELEPDPEKRVGTMC